MNQSLVLQRDVIDLMWNVIDRLPDNLYDFARDSFGLANLLDTCGFELAIVDDPNGALTVIADRQG
jgi:hypothetical protein